MSNTLPMTPELLREAADFISEPDTIFMCTTYTRVGGNEKELEALLLEMDALTRRSPDLPYILKNDELSTGCEQKEIRFMLFEFLALMLEGEKDG